MNTSATISTAPPERTRRLQWAEKRPGWWYLHGGDYARPYACMSNHTQDGYWTASFCTDPDILYPSYEILLVPVLAPAYDWSKMAARCRGSLSRRWWGIPPSWTGLDNGWERYGLFHTTFFVDWCVPPTHVSVDYGTCLWPIQDEARSIWKDPSPEARAWLEWGRSGDPFDDHTRLAFADWCFEKGKDVLGRALVSRIVMYTPEGWVQV